MLFACSEQGPEQALDGAIPAADASVQTTDASTPPSLRDASSDQDADASDSTPADASAGPVDASGEAGVVSRFESPHYQGSRDNGATCERDYATYGFLPALATGQRAPLFLYFPGTSFSASDNSARGDSEAGLAVSAAMARLGFVALSVDYDNTPLALFSDHASQLSCLFDAAKPASLIARACALPEVDCALGIATWGHSLGGYVSVAAHTRDARVSAAWATGYGGDATTTLPVSRLRVVNGEHDTTNGTAMVLNATCGYPASQCADQDSCLRPDGSGWVIVRQAALRAANASADHCWFDRASCSASSILLDPAWVDPGSTADFALASNTRWLATTARMPF